MTNLDNMFKSRDITLPTKVSLAKAMVFPVVMYGCESWTVKKVERRRIDAFELWYSHLFQNFPQFLAIHTVKGFSIVNKAEIEVFLELSCFFHDPVDAGNLISGSSAFSKTSLNI